MRRVHVPHERFQFLSRRRLGHGRVANIVRPCVVVWASRRGRASRTPKIRACEAHGVALHLTRRHRRRILCMIGTMAPWAERSESVRCLTKIRFPKTKTLLFHLTPYGKIRPRRTRRTICHLIWINFRGQHLVLKESLENRSLNHREKGVWGFLVFGKETSFFLLVTDCKQLQSSHFTSLASRAVCQLQEERPQAPCLADIEGNLHTNFALRAAALPS